MPCTLDVPVATAVQVRPSRLMSEGAARNSESSGDQQTGDSPVAADRAVQATPSGLVMTPPPDAANSPSSGDQEMYDAESAAVRPVQVSPSGLVMT